MAKAFQVTKGLEQPTEQPCSVRLREERQRVEPSQQEFARKIGISKVRQCQLETSVRELRGDYLIAISKLGLDVMYILTGKRNATTISAIEKTLLFEFREIGRGMQEEVLLSVKRIRSKLAQNEDVS